MTEQAQKPFVGRAQVGGSKASGDAKTSAPVVVPFKGRAVAGNSQASKEKSK